MSPARAAWLAWNLAALAILTSLVGAVVYWSADAHEFVAGDVYLAQFAAFAIVGAFVASSRPRNAIGWICIGVALSGGGS